MCGDRQILDGGEGNGGSTHTAAAAAAASVTAARVHRKGPCTPRQARRRGPEEMLRRARAAVLRRLPSPATTSAQEAGASRTHSEAEPQPNGKAAECVRSAV